EAAHTVANVEVLRFVSDGADTSLRGSVSRLLEAAGQQADLLVVDRWLDAVEEGMAPVTMAQALVAAGGMDQLDTAAFVDTLYRNVLGREADAAGKEFWSAAIDGGQLARGEALALLAGSPEKLAQEQVVELDVNASEVALLVRMYEALFARGADEDGLNYWIGRYEAGASLQRLADAFLASGEADARYGDAGDAQFVAMLYRSAFEREASADEQAFWVGHLASGALDRGDVLLDFANSSEMVGLVGVVDTGIPTL
uniref:DUF4214 domain-containing protein n=1 Tax=Massilia oculi TaxID=945844 RepID=UPI0028AB8991